MVLPVSRPVLQKMTLSEVLECQFTVYFEGKSQNPETVWGKDWEDCFCKASIAGAVKIIDNQQHVWVYEDGEGEKRYKSVGVLRETS